MRNRSKFARACGGSGWRSRSSYRLCTRPRAFGSNGFGYLPLLYETLGDPAKTGKISALPRVFSSNAKISREVCIKSHGIMRLPRQIPVRMTAYSRHFLLGDDRV